MGDAGHELTKRRHLLRLDEAGLGLLEPGQGVGQLVTLHRQFASQTIDVDSLLDGAEVSPGQRANEHVDEMNRECRAPLQGGFELLERDGYGRQLGYRLRGEGGRLSQRHGGQADDASGRAGVEDHVMAFDVAEQPDPPLEHDLDAPDRLVLLEENRPRRIHHPFWLVEGPVDLVDHGRFDLVVAQLRVAEEGALQSADALAGRLELGGRRGRTALQDCGTGRGGCPVKLSVLALELLVDDDERNHGSGLRQRLKPGSQFGRIPHHFDPDDFGGERIHLIAQAIALDRVGCRHQNDAAVAHGLTPMTSHSRGATKTNRTRPTVPTASPTLAIVAVVMAPVL